MANVWEAWPATPKFGMRAKLQFLNDIRTIVTLEEIPMELIIHWDQTPIKFIPVSNWTHDKKGTEEFSWRLR